MRWSSLLSIGIAAALVLMSAEPVSALVIRANKPLRGNYDNVANVKEIRKNTFNTASSKAVSTAAAAATRIPGTDLWVRIPKNWSQDSQKVTGTRTQVFLLPKKRAEHAIFGEREWIWIVATVLKKEMTLAELDAKFERDTQLSSDTQSLGDMYLPGMSELTTSDITIGGIAGRRYNYQTSWGREKKTGSTIYVAYNGMLYELWFRSPLPLVKAASPLFEELLMKSTFTTKASSASSASSKAARSQKSKKG